MALMLALLPALARAQEGFEDTDPNTEPQNERQYVELGRRRMFSGHYEEARQAFQSAYDLKPRGLYLFEMAQALRKAGRAQEAVAMYERFRREDPYNPLSIDASDYSKQLLDSMLRARDRPEPTPSYRRWWFWSALGVATIGLGMVGFGANGLAVHGKPETELGPGEYVTLAPGAVLLGSGLGLLLGGTILAIVPRKSNSAR